MYCENCGKENTNDAKFCEGCGAPLNISSEPVTLTPAEPTGNRATLIVLVVVIIAVIAGLVWGGISLFGGNKLLAPMNNIIKAIDKEDSEYYLKSVPKDVVKAAKKTDSDLEDEFEEGAELINEMLEDEYGKNFKIKAKIVEKKKIDKDDIEDLEDDIYLNGIDVDDIEAAYEVEYEVTVKGKDGKEDAKFETHIGKIDGKWYFIDIDKDPLNFIVDEFLDREKFYDEMYNDDMYVGG